jgi:hypothetical protein
MGGTEPASRGGCHVRGCVGYLEGGQEKGVIMTFSKQALTQFMLMTDWKAFSANGMLPCATFSAASCAILQALGPDWSQKHIGNVDQACEYFRARRDNHHELLFHLSRTIEFGELICNLHDVNGFDERIESIRTDDKGGVESGIAELIAGKFLKIAGVMFWYVSSKTLGAGNKPKNADIEYAATQNRLEACEVKCNLLSTELNECSIKNSLKTAKKQLPSGGAGIILLRVPETWLVDMEAGTTVIGKAIDDFIKSEKTKRVSSIFVFASETRFLPDDKMSRGFLVKEIRNDYCPLHAGISTRSVMWGGEGRWRTLESFAERELRMNRLL